MADAFAVAQGLLGARVFACAFASAAGAAIWAVAAPPTDAGAARARVAPRGRSERAALLEVLTSRVETPSAA